MLKVSILDKVYTITTDEREHVVLKAAQRVHDMLSQQIAHSKRLSVAVDKSFLFAMLQLAVEVEKKTSELDAFHQQAASLEKILTESL